MLTKEQKKLLSDTKTLINQNLNKSMLIEFEQLRVLLKVQELETKEQERIDFVETLDAVWDAVQHGFSVKDALDKAKLFLEED